MMTATYGYHPTWIRPLLYSFPICCCSVLVHMYMIDVYPYRSLTPLFLPPIKNVYYIDIFSCKSDYDLHNQSSWLHYSRFPASSSKRWLRWARIYVSGKLNIREPYHERRNHQPSSEHITEWAKMSAKEFHWWARLVIDSHPTSHGTVVYGTVVYGDRRILSEIISVRQHFT